ncbi:aspartyl-phosphate phosphatase Spo0E family protein [Tepidibacter formicigenes]|jgi:hypothetical protein|uniref:Spo0E like sporulation regulatory protein n=1 Tax=Tepidibacter formicigenes DSM 15518 TaxID=1123349 RepID=A0A1M6TK30_9FIRM|nr:aspartyl-phosphate phosphatase Spo0E family protein [Tepidibacter formicigenes]SHK57297.1 Spo0E like sporulation regulatory protein [Tepidibacter formicigenes DSM 15518]
MRLHILKRQIENTRKRLNMMLNDKNIIKTNGEVLKLSQELDVLINEYIYLKKDDEI